MSPRALCSVVAVLAAALAAAAGCSARALDRARVEAEQAPLVYGSDDRHDWYAEADARWRRIASASSVALIDRTLITRGASGNLQLPEESYGELYDLCPGERFAEQPSAAECSGVLIASDLVLTAAHCMRALPCEEWSLVFGYRYAASGRLHAIHEDDVFACAGVAALDYVRDDAEHAVDYAVLQLDRRVGREHTPARIADDDAEPLARGDEVVVIGDGAGLPTKIDRGGRVADARTAWLDYFTTDSDDFHGGSGSGVFDRSGALRGIVARGGADYRSSAGGCQRVRTESDPHAAEEHITYAARALDELCAGPHAPSEACRSRSVRVLNACGAVSPGAGSARPHASWLVLLAAFALHRRGRRATAT